MVMNKNVVTMNPKFYVDGITYFDTWLTLQAADPVMWLTIQENLR